MLKDTASTADVTYFGRDERITVSCESKKEENLDLSYDGNMDMKETNLEYSI